MRARVVAWWLSSPRSAYRRLIFRLLPSFICWHIWKARNASVFEGSRMHPTTIYQAVASDIRSAVEIHFHTRLGLLSFPQLYEWSGRPSSRVSFQIVRWTARSGFLTMNTDGCSKGNPGCSGGGGILRDALGGPILAFSAFFGIRSSLHAEAPAMLIGLRLCVKQGFVKVDLQSDLQVLVGIIQRRLRCPWQIRTEIEQIWDLTVAVARVSHCYRETNRVAGILANVGVSHPQ